MKNLIKWLDGHAGAIQALTAMLTVLIALGALVGVKLQMDASERLQREQSARDIYREFLNLSISKPEFATPNYCAMTAEKDIAAYENYVEYMLYTADQTVAADPDWKRVFISSMGPHKDYLCSIKDWSVYSDDVEDLGAAFRTGSCASVKPCTEN